MNKNKNRTSKYSLGGSKNKKFRLLAFLLCGAMTLGGCLTFSGCSDGKDGTNGTIWYQGTDYSTATSAVDGDYFIDTDDYILYQKVDGQWVVVIDNYGKPGTDGTDGTDGEDGATWFNGSTEPTASQGDDGDYYINTTTYDTYQKINGKWTRIGNIKGDDGEKGADGTNGTNGEDGASNYVWIKYADAEPTSSDVSLSDEVSNWMGIYNGSSATAPTDYTQYQWIQIKETQDRYVWVKYADTIPTQDSDMKDEIGDYIGIYSGASATAPTSYTSYKWFSSNVEYVWAKNTLEVSDFTDKTITTLGDSITNGAYSTQVDGNNTGWNYHLGLLLGATIENKGRNGTTFSDDAYQSDGSKAYSRVDDVASYTGSPDYFIVALGNNDWTLSTNVSDGNTNDGIPLGTLGSLDTTTIYGAINYYAKTLKERFEGTSTKIIFATPIYSTTKGTPTTDNSLGYNLTDICDAIKETCALYGIEVADMYNLSDINASTFSTYMYDGVHPNDTGYEHMAEVWKEYLLSNYTYVPVENTREVTISDDGTQITENVVVNGYYTLPETSSTTQVWTSSLDGKTYSGGERVQITKDITFTKTLTESEYVVTIQNYYGKIRESSKDTTVTTSGVLTSNELTTAIDESYGLVPTYYSNSSMTEEVDFDDVITANTTIYVNWETRADWFTVTDSKITAFSDTLLEDENISSITKVVFPSVDSDGNAIMGLLCSNNALSMITNSTLFNKVEKYFVPEGYTSLQGTFLLSNNISRDLTSSSCNYVTSTFYIPTTLTSFGDLSLFYTAIERFVVADGNSYFSTDDNGILYNKDKTKLVKIPTFVNITEYVMPSTVTQFGSRAFSKLIYVTNITISENAVTSWGQYLFQSNAKLRELTILCDISKVNRLAFTQMTGLTSIVVKDETAKTELENLFKYGTTTEGDTVLDDYETTYATYVDMLEIQS